MAPESRQKGSSASQNIGTQLMVSQYIPQILVLFGVPGLKGNGVSISMFWLAFLGGFWQELLIPRLESSLSSTIKSEG